MQKTCQREYSEYTIVVRQAMRCCNLLLFQHVPNNASPFTKIYKETSARIVDMNAICCEAFVFDFCITSNISRISFYTTTSSCSSCPPQTLSLRARCERQKRCPPSRCTILAFRRCATQKRPGANQNTAILDQVLQSTPASLAQGHVRVASTPGISKQADGKSFCDTQ